MLFSRNTIQIIAHLIITNEWELKHLCQTIPENIDRNSRRTERSLEHFHPKNENNYAHWKFYLICWGMNVCANCRLRSFSFQQALGELIYAHKEKKFRSVKRSSVQFNFNPNNFLTRNEKNYESNCIHSAENWSVLFAKSKNNIQRVARFKRIGYAFGTDEKNEQ